MIKAKRLVEKDVFKAADEIVKSGEQPTVLNIHALLKRGSLTTISKHFQRWSEDNDEAYDLDANIFVPDLITNDLTLMSKKIWTTAINIARAEFDTQRDQFNETSEAREELLREAAINLGYADEKIEDYERKLVTLEKELEHTKETLAANTKSHNDTVSMLTSSFERSELANAKIVKSLEDQVKSLTQELKASTAKKVVKAKSGGKL